MSYLSIEKYFPQSPIIVFDATISYTKDGEFMTEQLYSVPIQDRERLLTVFALLKATINETLEIRISMPQKLQQ